MPANFQRSVAGYRTSNEFILRNSVQSHHEEDYAPITYVARHAFAWNFMRADILSNLGRRVSIVNETSKSDNNIAVYGHPGDWEVAERVLVMSSTDEASAPPLASFLRSVTFQLILGQNLLGPRQDLDRTAQDFFPNEPIENAKILTLRGYMTSLVLKQLRHEFDGSVGPPGGLDMEYYQELQSRGYETINPEQLYALGERAVKALIAQG